MQERKKNNIWNETSNGSGDSVFYCPEDLQSHHGKMEGLQFWNPGWDINMFSLHKELLLKRMGLNILK